MKHELVPCRSMFANGTDYEWFLETNCFNCTKFRNWKCRIVNACENARFQGESVFPFDELLDFVGVGGKRCKSFTDEPQTRHRRENPLDGQIEMEATV